MYFENKSDKNSGSFSDIFDCDTLLPLELPEIKKPGYMPKNEDASVITVNGMFEGSFYWKNDKVSASECAKDAGMRLMLWLEPERAIKGTEITKNILNGFLKSPATATKF